MTSLRISVEDPSRVDLGSLLATEEGVTIGHEPRVLDALAAAYRLRGEIVVARRDGVPVGALPLVRIRGPLGAIDASVAYLDGGGPIGPPDVRDALVAFAAARSASRGAVLELRASNEPTAPDGFATVVSRDKDTLVRALPKDPDEIAKGLDPKTRNQLRKALREGLSSDTVAATPGTIAAFRAVYARTLRDLGSPPHALEFFERLVAALSGRAHVARVIASTGELLAAALVLDDRRGGSVLPWAASDRRADALEPNTLLYHELLTAAVERGRARFDFGRSTRESAQFKFKTRWGAEPTALHWTTISRGARRAPVAREKEGKLRHVVAAWRQLPVRLSSSLGPVLLRWLPA
ncbi:MAG: GNAT family N-acetyltransferase [Planctomycetota bacterium]